MHWWLGQHLAITALLAVLVLLVCRLFRLGPATRHLLWLLVLLKLIVPPLVRWPWSIEEMQATVARWQLVQSEGEAEPTMTALPAATGQSAKPAPPSAPAEPPVPLSALPPELFEELLAHERARLASLPPTKPAEPAPLIAQAAEGEAESLWPWEGLALGCWLAGALAIFGVELVRIVRCVRLVGRGQPAPESLVRLVQQMAARLELAPPPVRIVAGLCSPMVWTLGKPLLLWPAEMLERFELEQRRAIVAHELAHLRRRDHWVGRLLLAAEIVWWWNPLFWLVRRELRRTAEWACDAWVVWALPGQRRSYAETLIEVTRVASRTLPAPALGIGAGRGARQSFQRRLTMIMCEQVSCRPSRWAVLLIGAVALAVLPGWSLAQTPDIQVSVEAKLALERLNQSLAKLEGHKKQLEDEVSRLRKQLEALNASKSQNTDVIVQLRDQIDGYNNRLALLQGDNLSNTAFAFTALQEANALDPLIVGKIYGVTSGDKRSYGPEQATGAPDSGESASDNPKAWASKTEDAQDEWITLAYEPSVQPMAILVYENYNPGALYKVSVFTPGGGDQSLEREVWKGNDPTPAGSGRGVSLIPVKVHEKVTHVKLYLRSTAVRGWNEIDAVGLLDAEGKIHWALRAEASTSYADRETTSAGSRALYDNYLRGRVITGDSGTSRSLTTVREQQRLDRLEKDMKEVKDMLQKLIKQSSQKPEGSGGGEGVLPILLDRVRP